MNLLCKWLGHSWKIALNEDEEWIQCSRCKEQEDVPIDRLDEFYLLLNLGIYSWKK